MKKRTTALLLAMVMLVSLLAACGSQPSDAASAPETSSISEAEPVAVSAEPAPVPAEPSNAEPEPALDASSESPEPADVSGPPDPTTLDLTDEYSVLRALQEVETTNVYPIEGDLHTFKMWTPFQNQNGIVNGYDDLPFVPLLEEATNVHIEFQESPNSSASEQFNLIVASNDYPDLFRNFTAWYSAGATSAYEQDVIIDMTDLVDAHMPYYQYCLQLHDTDRKNVTDENGMMLYISAVVQYEAVGQGPGIRQDWLDTLGLDRPHTMDELENVLLAFKSELGVETPLDINSGNYASSFFITAYDTLGLSFQQENGTVTYGGISDGFKAYLEKMSKWYDMGLFSKDFMSITDNPRDPIFTEMLCNGKVGVFSGRATDWVSYINGNVDSNANYTGLAPTVLQEGDLNHFYDTPRTVNNGTIAISTQCSDPTTAAIWMDYMYSYEGSVLLCYGIEGESYNMIDGVPVFDYDYIRQFAADHDWDNTRYAAWLYYNPFNDWFGMRAYMIDPSTAPEVTEALDIWNDSQYFSEDNYRLPMTLTYTNDESDERNALQSDIDTYTSETIAKFITGELNLDSDWDAYVNNMKTTMNIDRLAEITEAAYARYTSK